MEIFELLCANQNMVLNDDCKAFSRAYFAELYDNRNDDYANGRDVRNYFEKVVKMRANRLKPILNSISLEEYRTISKEDLVNAKQLKSNGW